MFWAFFLGGDFGEENTEPTHLDVYIGWLFYLFIFLVLLVYVEGLGKFSVCLMRWFICCDGGHADAESRRRI
jgi:hypothetical protein